MMVASMRGGAKRLCEGLFEATHLACLSDWLGRSSSAWGGVALSGRTVVHTSCCSLPSRKQATQREWH